ncbi:MAG: hypothetical protein NTX26_02610, partial [Candidatus Parcubacteria bacterium]|nr:hypothetical protein [Candidatus Parcubacteria bacterium]
MKSLFSRDLRIVLTIAFLWLFLGNPQAKAANFVIGTASSTCRVGSSITLNILLNSPDIAANAVQGDITYHFDSLSLASINIKDTLIQFWVHTPVINNASGTVSFEGAIMTPGYLGKTGRILSLIFNCRQEGITPISFSSGSILANDGKGTSILDNLSSLNITILPQTTVTTKETGIVGGTKANPKLI